MAWTLRRRLVVALLVLLTVWPVVHLWLAFRFQVSPWKLCGWGMYATPRFDQVGMEIYGRETAESEPRLLVDPDPEVRAAATRFLESFRWLRELTPRGSLVEVVLAAHPAWREIEVVVFRPHMDAATGVVRTERVAYRHRRAGDLD
jgi:hypothetical protein